MSFVSSRTSTGSGSDAAISRARVISFEFPFSASAMTRLMRASSTVIDRALIRRARSVSSRRLIRVFRLGLGSRSPGSSIVRTYRDNGESGLKLKNRTGLLQLLDDVQSGQADFGHILVYDVSRWGRFQDTDESAHYEFVCKKAGLKVAYCAEEFDNDGTMLSSIVKNLKRVMAAEYSRELSMKVHAGALRFARMGFRTCGEVGYGLRRQLVNERWEPKAILQKGDRKYLMTDHVRVVAGPANEVAVVKWVFEEFLKGRFEWDIARELDRSRTATNTGRPWNGPLIGRMLRNECYVGDLIYNRYSKKLGEKRNCNPPAMWAKCEGCIEPIIQRDVFWRAQRIIKDRRISLSDEETFKRLRITLMKRGKLTTNIINETVGLPCAASLMQRFGSIRETYRLIGYISKRDCEYIEARKGWAAVNADLASELATEIQKRGGKTVLDGECLTIDGATNVSFRVARWRRDGLETYAPHWTIERKRRLPPGWIIAIRLADKNKDVRDYLLLRTSSVTKATLRFTENARKRHKVESFEKFPTLIRSFMRRFPRRGDLAECSCSPSGVDCKPTIGASANQAPRRRLPKTR
jgi:DNA invertase Pin-like site-specific DNA recombinase